MKEIIKKIVPAKAIQWLRRMKYSVEVRREAKFVKRKVLRYSITFNRDRNASLARLMIRAHVLEKGITMPERRLGFGYGRVRELIGMARKHMSVFGADDAFFQAVLADLKQYQDIHKEAGFQLPEDITKGIDALLPSLVADGENCFAVSREEFFKPSADFAEFAKSRHSVRWFSDTPVDEDKLMDAIRLAQTAPSACNRQATRVKIVASEEGKKLCQALQHGNRGFGDKADKWLLVTSELGDWSHDQVDMVYIDAGIFTMNLLYALHYYGFVACTLNAHIEVPKREELYKGLGIPESELLAAFIVIGNPAESFMVPRSHRLKVEDIVRKV